MKDSTVSDHLLQCNCTIDFDHFAVLATDVCKFNLLVKESLLINPDHPVLIRTTKSSPLELFDLFTTIVSKFDIKFYYYYNLVNVIVTNVSIYWIYRSIIRGKIVIF